MEKRIAKGLGGDRKAPKKLQDKPTMEKRIAKGVGAIAKPPKKPQAKPAMEMWNAKGFGGDRKAPKIRKPNLLWKRKLRRGLAKNQTKPCKKYGYQLDIYRFIEAIENH